MPGTAGRRFLSATVSPVAAAPGTYNAGVGEERGRTRRRLVGLVIVAFWVAMTAWLVQREVLPRQRGSGRAAPPPAARERWYGLFAPEGRLGTVYLVQRAEDRNGVPGATVQVTASLSVAAAGSPAQVKLGGSLWRPLGDGPAEIEGTVTSGEHELAVRGTIANGVLDAVLYSAGEEVPVRTRLDTAAFAAASPLGTALPALAPGEETTVSGFDPLTFTPARVRVRRLPERERPAGGPEGAAQVLAVKAGASTLTVWTDGEGEILEASTPFGLVLRRLTREASLAGAEMAAAPELFARTLVAPRGQRPFRGARRMVVRLAGVEETPPEDDAQIQLGGGAYRIAQQPPLPVVPGTVAPAGFLAPEPLVQSDHPRILAQAAAIVAGAAEPWARVQRLSRWVFTELDKRSVLSLPSALDVLASREGDCNEHTVLFTALARAAGVPCRMAVGIVWSEELGAFGYHAWPEVWVGRWVRVDPTLGQEIADATHVKLVAGGVERWGQVLAYLGRLQVEVVTVE